MRTIVNPGLLKIRNWISGVAIALSIASLSGDLAIARDPKCLESALQTLLRNAPAKGQVRSLDEIRELRIATYNLLNLAEHVGEYRYAPDGRLLMKHAPRKAELEKVAGKARAIREINPDILIAQEVEGGLKTLQTFADEQLDGAYNAYLAAGNDSRGIDIGFLVKKDLPITIELETHRAVTWVDPTRAKGEPAPLYSRDLPAMIIRTPLQKSPDHPLLVVLGNHSKSMRNRPRDAASRILRKAQTNKTAEIVNEYRKRFGKKARIVLGGDFNTPIESREMRSLAGQGLSEAFSVSKHTVPPKERVTHTFHPRDGPRKLNQLDAFYVSPELSGDISKTWIYRYKDSRGRPLPLPRTHAERELNPSDHFPLVMDVNFQAIYRSFQREQRIAK